MSDVCNICGQVNDGQESHYHCARCGEESGAFGHFDHRLGEFTCEQQMHIHMANAESTIYLRPGVDPNPPQTFINLGVVPGAGRIDYPGGVREEIVRDDGSPAPMERMTANHSPTISVSNNAEYLTMDRLARGVLDELRKLAPTTAKALAEQAKDDTLSLAALADWLEEGQHYGIAGKVRKVKPEDGDLLVLTAPPGMTEAQMAEAREEITSLFIRNGVKCLALLMPHGWQAELVRTKGGAAGGQTVPVPPSGTPIDP